MNRCSSGSPSFATETTEDDANNKVVIIHLKKTKTEHRHLDVDPSSTKKHAQSSSLLSSSTSSASRIIEKKTKKKKGKQQHKAKKKTIPCWRAQFPWMMIALLTFLSLFLGQRGILRISSSSSNNNHNNNYSSSPGGGVSAVVFALINSSTGTTTTIDKQYNDNGNINNKYEDGRGSSSSGNNNTSASSLVVDEVDRPSTFVAGRQVAAATTAPPPVTTTRIETTTMTMTPSRRTPAVLLPKRIIRVWNTSNVREFMLYNIWRAHKICYDIIRGISKDPNFTATTPPASSSSAAAPMTTRNLGVVNLTFSCQGLYQRGNAGTGNWITAFFIIRQAALASQKLEVVFHCADADYKKKDLVTPWFMGHFPLPEDLLPPPRGDAAAASEETGPLLGEHFNQTALPSMEQACQEYKDVPLVAMFPFIRHEMRRMAVATVGVPSPDHASAKFVERYLQTGMAGPNNNDQLYRSLAGTMQLAADPSTPTYPGVELDEVALHFRCGDIIYSDHRSFGFINFKGFTDLIPRGVQSIGIVTQPYFAGRRQDMRGDMGVVCQQVVLALVDYIRERFPTALVRVHNDPAKNETLVLAQARMIMAKVTISTVSSFSVFSAVANFGIGYIKRPEDSIHAPSRFLLELPPNDPDVQLFDAPFITASQVKELRDKTGNYSFLLDWFRNDTHHCIEWEGPTTPILKLCLNNSTNQTGERK